MPSTSRATFRRVSVGHASRSRVVLGLWLMVCSTATLQAQWQPLAATQADPLYPGSDARWESQQPPRGLYDRIRLHRFPTTSEPQATLLYLPGTNMNGSFNVDREHDLARHLAENGVEVFTLDYRTHAVPPEGVTDFAFMFEWTLERFNADARAALEQVQSLRPETPVFAAGFSRGASLATTLACTAPEGLAGLALLDGHLKSADLSKTLQRTAGNELEEARRELAAHGPAESDVAAGIGWPERDALMKEVARDPSAPATDGSSADLGQQLAGLLYRAWGPGRLAHPMGSPDGRGISRPEILASLLEDYDRYYPNIQNIEGRLIGAVADHPDTALDDCWGELEIPLLWFGTTGMGAPWLLDGLFSAVHAGAESLEVHVLEGYGHLDLLISESSPRDVYRPLLEWLGRHTDAAPSESQ